jgi:osmotically-inducible protein OsmY
MGHVAVRRRPGLDPATVLVGAAAGFAAGAVLGFLLGEFGAPVRAPRRRPPRPGARRIAARIRSAQSALDADLQLHDARLSVVPAGRGRVELHGWVNTRAARSRAGQLAARAVPDQAVINGILVRGEDDVDTDDDGPDPDHDALPA